MTVPVTRPTFATSCSSDMASVGKPVWAAASDAQHRRAARIRGLNKSGDRNWSQYASRPNVKHEPGR